MELGFARYGKAEIRLLRVTREAGRERLADLTVWVALDGDFDAAYRLGDNARILPTDSQKNAVWALANEGVGEIEGFALRLARHFAASLEGVGARVAVEERPWEPIQSGPDAFRQAGEVRRAVAVSQGGEWVLSGMVGMELLKTSGSAFRGFMRDRYTTLEETSDRILATSVDARWLHASTAVDWATSREAVRHLLLQTFAHHRSRSLQHTLFAMGQAVLEARPEVVEVRLSMPNRHHFPIDMAPLGMENRGLYFPDDRPYGLIQGSVRRPGAAVPPAWVWE
jgi:urate oxidase